MTRTRNQVIHPRSGDVYPVRSNRGNFTCTCARAGLMVRGCDRYPLIGDHHVARVALRSPSRMCCTNSWSNRVSMPLRTTASARLRAEGASPLRSARNMPPPAGCCGQGRPRPSAPAANLLARNWRPPRQTEPSARSAPHRRAPRTTPRGQGCLRPPVLAAARRGDRPRPEFS